MSDNIQPLPEKDHLSFSPAALQHFQHCLRDKPQGAGVRLIADKGGCGGLKYVNDLVDAPSPGDFYQQIAEGVLLYMDEASIPYLRGLMLDIKLESLGQKKVIYVNPNAKATCGCGESFSA